MGFFDPLSLSDAPVDQARRSSLKRRSLCHVMSCTVIELQLLTQAAAHTLPSVAPKKDLPSMSWEQLNLSAK